MDFCSNFFNPKFRSCFNFSFFVLHKQNRDVIEKMAKTKFEIFEPVDYRRIMSELFLSFMRVRVSANPESYIVVTQNVPIVFESSYISDVRTGLKHDTPYP